MHPREELEHRCRESYKKLSRAERVFGLNSIEANRTRVEWAAYDSAYRLVYNDRIDYYNNNKKL